jgi:hypothetical protein
MKNIIKKILKETVLKEGIPIYSEYESNTNKKMFERIKSYYKNTPEYIVKDFFINNIKQYTNDIIKNYYNDPVLFLARFDGGYWDRFLKGPWNLEILTVNPNDFDDRTVNAFLERDFGNVDSYLVPKDEERMNTQKKLAKSSGMNEPIIVERKPNGKYELIEGWHRTMSILLLGNNGEDLKNWDKVKIRAFVRDLYKAV